MLEQTPMMSAGTHKSITIEEYERLKRMEENVKELIKEGKVAVATNSLIKRYSESDQQIWANIVKLLESLCEPKAV